MPLARYHGRTRGAPGSFCPQRPRAWQNIQAQMAHEVNATICRACRGNIACRQTVPYPPAEPFCSGAAALAEGLAGTGVTGPLGARRALCPRGSGTLGGGQCSAPFCRVELCATTRTCARIGIRAGNRSDGIMAGRGLAAECVRCSREHIGKTDMRKAGRYRNFTYNANRGCVNPASGLHDRWEIRKLFPFMRARNIGAHSFRQRLKKCLAPICALFVYRCIHQRKQQG